MTQIAPNVAQLQEIIETQKRVITALQHEVSWYEELLGNPTLPGTDIKFLGKITPREIKMGLTDTAEEKKVYLPAVAEKLDTSDKTLSRHLRKLAKETGAFTYRTVEEENKDGLPVSRTYLGFCAPLASPALLALPPTGHGGKRIKYCKDCGSTNLVEVKQTFCADCGSPQGEKITTMVNDLPYSQDDRREETPADEPLDSPTDKMTVGSPPVENSSCPSSTVDTGGYRLPPAELRALPIWCPWRYEEPENPRADGKLDKVPYQARGRVPQRARTNDAATWITYEQAQAMVEQSIREGWKRPFDGIGFMCDGSFVGIDLDHCRNKETGEISEGAIAIVALFSSSYTYITPSGEGLRIVIHAKKPGTHCKKGDIEIYEEKRFFTWTPEHLPGTPGEIVECQAELDAFYKELWPEEPAPISTKFVEMPCSCSDEKIVEKARGAANGAKFRRLYDQGDITGYPSASEADLALCEMLSYWGAASDVSTIDRLFRHSRLMRPKWDEPARAGDGTYGQGTMARAIALAMGEQERRAS